MNFTLWVLVFHIICISLNNLTGGLLIDSYRCSVLKQVPKTRVQWKLWNSKFISYTQYYNDYERVSVCCDGYEKISDTLCQPICTPACPSYSQCIRPNVCECNTGYMGYSAGPSIIKCLPTCLPECPKNSSCSPGNTCVCDDGFVKNSSGICELKCHDKCPENSTCDVSNKCSCNEGYKHNNDSLTCDPVCSVTCPENSLCSGPETCLCSDGYELGETEENTLVCIPKCQDDCPGNSFCSRPNFCECDSGYRKSLFSNCEPVCEIACPAHSSCTAPNNCTCGKGYEMVDNLCQPMCNNSCPDHAQCVQPNKCECIAGYQLKLSPTYNIYCEPQCQQKCSTFGKCIQPNKCECLEGYEMNEMEICKPICSNGCTNGLCFRPGVCICNPGYLMGPNEQCEPVCSMPCQNATCVEPEICQCSVGYSMKKGSVSVCEPQCRPECINGVCVDANVCICHDNYEHALTANGGYNHSNCQRIETTTLPTTTTAAQTYMTLKYSSFSDSDASSKYSDESTAYSENLIPDNMDISSTPPPLVNSNVCTDRCQCWEEYDILGTLSSGPHCVHSCLDAYDKPCLNFSLCQCDNSKNELHCKSGDDEESISVEDDFLLYVCKIPNQKEFIKDITNSKTIEIRNTGYSKSSTGNFWIILGSIIGACAIASLAAVMYIKCKRYEDPIIEYEL